VSIKVPIRSGRYSSGSGEVVIDDDNDELANVDWFIYRIRDKLYAACWEENRLVFMHRLISGAERYDRVLHRDGDTFNNTRDNLVVVPAVGSSVVLRFLREYSASNGFPPTMREIANGAVPGRRVSLATVSHQLDVLEEAGTIRRSRRKARGISSLEAVYRY
jgi:hypothetical protein